MYVDKTDQAMSKENSKHNDENELHNYAHDMHELQRADLTLQQSFEHAIEGKQNLYVHKYD